MRVIAAVIALALQSCQPSPSFAATGPASFYRIGSRTASGEPYHPGGLSMAHASCRFGSEWLAEANGRSVVVRCNDRPGPGVARHHRIADLSAGAAHALGIQGVSVIKLTEVAEAPASSQQYLESPNYGVTTNDNQRHRHSRVHRRGAWPRRHRLAD